MGLDRYPEIVGLIMNAGTRADGRLSIQKLLDCDEICAQVILDTQLEQLTKERRNRLAAEIEHLKGSP